MTTTLARRAGVFALIAATAATTLTGCAGVVGAKMTFEDTEKTKITDIRLDGSSGDVTIRAAAVTETSIKRIVRRTTGDPGESYRLEGSTLVVDTSCGHDCSVSYEIVAPTGVKVGGELKSGDIALDAVGDTDVKLTSGNINVTDPAGTVKLRATSGDMRVVNAKKATRVEATSGNINVIDMAGPLELRVTSGDISATLTTPNSVTAQTTSGTVQVQVPQGDYKIVTSAGSGDASVNGLVSNPAAKNVLDLRTGSGDATVSAA
ncbi:DUF4097 domain-containing protein [Actinoplanes bogorensis]|uniref:DUF4097 domain-containing protein n=1 Tax=Paractinoplanes bogorensis TaxID=1610840 RepID=A0ABS5Z271_9ACTN|nr:DUF4097 family beta strand repeat-containing protein [Actinoplanes bogorensis]MBU2669785.1 DUF4097 domain-containing protein [Actinoplanes bogorensis]